MIKYPKIEKGGGKFFYHTESQQGPVRIKILKSALKKGKDVGGYAAKGEKAEAEYFLYKVMRTDKREQIWGVEADSQIGGEMAKQNVSDGDVIKVVFLGNVMPTAHGMKAKYQIIKEGMPQANPRLVEEAKEVFDVPEEKEEIGLDDFDE